jgi:hypothetical protein
MEEAGQVRSSSDVCGVELGRKSKGGMGALHDGEQDSCRDGAAVGEGRAQAQTQPLVQHSGQVQQV